MNMFISRYLGKSHVETLNNVETLYGGKKTEIIKFIKSIYTIYLTHCDTGEQIILSTKFKKFHIVFLNGPDETHRISFPYNSRGIHSFLSWVHSTKSDDDLSLSRYLKSCIKISSEGQ